MAVPEVGEGSFPREYLEEGIERLQQEDSESHTPETQAAIDLAAEALENLEV